LPLFHDIVEHRKEYDTFNVDVGAPSSSYHIFELRNVNLLAVAVEGVHYDCRGRQIESLS